MPTKTNDNTNTMRKEQHKARTKQKGTNKERTKARRKKHDKIEIIKQHNNEGTIENEEGGEDASGNNTKTI